jgi:hypothetical protein
MVTESLKKSLNILLTKYTQEALFGEKLYDCPIYRMHGA